MPPAETDGPKGAPGSFVGKAECGKRLHVRVLKAGSVSSGLHRVDIEGDEGISGLWCGGEGASTELVLRCVPVSLPARQDRASGAASGAVFASGPGEPLCVFCILTWVVVLGVYTVKKTEVLGLNSSCSI